MTRAERRAQVERAKARAARQCARWKLEPTPENVGKLATTRKECSCYMCGNPRRHHAESTMQERRLGVGKGGYWS